MLIEDESLFSELRAFVETVIALPKFETMWQLCTTMSIDCNSTAERWKLLQQWVKDVTMLLVEMCPAFGVAPGRSVFETAQCIIRAAECSTKVLRILSKTPFVRANALHPDRLSMAAVHKACVAPLLKTLRCDSQVLCTQIGEVLDAACTNGAAFARSRLVSLGQQLDVTSEQAKVASTIFASVDVILEKLIRAGLESWAKVVRDDLFRDDRSRVADLIWTDFDHIFAYYCCRLVHQQICAVLPLPSRVNRLLRERFEHQERKSRAVKEIITYRAQKMVHDKRTVELETDLGRFLAYSTQLASKKTTRLDYQRIKRNYDEIVWGPNSTLLDALPVWIIPTDAVSELRPPRIGAFDVVVIDEASQSDLSALPALLRGKQLVVIGDEQQVSPPEDNNEKRKKELIEVLGDMPAATKDNMIPGRSIFDLFSSEFSSNKVSSIYSLPW
jgi:hypothetical protein